MSFNDPSVTRVSVSSEDAAQISAQVATRQEAERAGAKNTVSSRVIGGVARTTIATTTDALGATRQTTEKTTADFARVNAGDLSSETTPGAPIFKSSVGRVLTTSEIKPDTLVTVGGVTTNVRAALHAGLLREVNGQYVSASGVSASPAQQQQEPEHQQQQQQQQPPEPAPTIDALDPHSEAIMSDVVSKVAQPLAIGTLRELIDNGENAPSTIERVAEQLNVSPAEAGQRIETLKIAFDGQARRAIGGNSEAVLEYARQHQPQALKDAMRAHVMDGTTEGYRALARSYIEDLATVNPQAILSSKDAAARGVRQERDGSITVLHPKAGRVAWKVAVRTGLIKPNFG